MTPLFGDPRHSLVDDELRLIKDRGLVVGAIFHGSDIRSPQRHMARLSHSFFRLWEESPRKALEEQATRRRDALEASGILSFVSTPDLILDLPSATWLPLVIDSRRWVNDRRALKNTTPVVFHAPSRRKPPIKGTDIIEPVLADLDRRGLIDYRSPPGTVPHHQMPGLVKEADVVVEQILAGSYGVSAVEGMAAGRLVIGYVGNEVRMTMPEDPPILDTTPEDFLSTMIQVINKRADYTDLAANGPSYVERIHSGRMSAQVLAPFLGLGT